MTDRPDQDEPSSDVPSAGPANDGTGPPVGQGRDSAAPPVATDQAPTEPLATDPLATDPLATEPAGPTAAASDQADPSTHPSGVPTVPPFAHQATSPSDTTETVPLDLPTAEQLRAADPNLTGEPAGVPGGSEPAAAATPTLVLPRDEPQADAATETAESTDLGTDSDDEFTDADGKPRVPRDPKSRLVLVTLLLAIVAFGLNLLSITNATRLSALDEATHIDYAYRLSQGELTFDGQPLSTYTTDSWACRKQANIRNLPACDSGAPYSSFPGDGLQYNAFHPPLYYAVTGLGARFLAAVTGQDFITMARAIGGIWLFLGMLGLYLSLRYWRVGWGWALGASFLPALIPVILHGSSIVSNDAPVVLAGVAGLFLLGRHVIYRNYGWILPVLFTLLAALTKVISTMALAAVGIAVIVLGIARWRKEGAKAGIAMVRNGVLMGLTIGAVQIIWQQIQVPRRPPGYRNPIEGVNTNKVIGSPFSEWIPTLFNGSRLGSSYYVDPYVNNAYLSGWVTFIVPLLAAAGLIGLALFRRGTPQWILAGTTVLGIVLYPLVVQLQTWWNADNYFPGVSTRYGSSLIPLALAVLAMIAERKRLRITSSFVLLFGFFASGTAAMSLLQPPG